MRAAEEVAIKVIGCLNDFTYGDEIKSHIELLIEQDRKEVARRCIEICLNYDYGDAIEVSEAIEKEFKLR